MKSDQQQKTEAYKNLIDTLRSAINKDKKQPKHEFYSIEPLSSFTNQVYKVSILPQFNQKPQKLNLLPEIIYNFPYVIKIYRPIFPQFTNTELQNQVIKKLSQLSLYPPVYLTNSELRIQKYVDQAYMPKIQQISIQQIKAVVKKLAIVSKQLNNLFKNKENNIVLQIKYLKKKFDQISQQCKRNQEKDYKIVEKYINQVLYCQNQEQNISKVVQKIINDNKIQMVPSHNDCHFANVLIKKLENEQKPFEIILLDYQFANNNYRGFDLGNFFNQCAIDYLSFQIKNQLQMPENKKKQLIIQYYSQLLNQAKQNIQQNYDRYQQQVNIGRMLSHLFWMFIGVKQLCDPKMQIDMKYYVKRRYQQTLNWINKIKK